MGCFITTGANFNLLTHCQLRTLLNFHATQANWEIIKAIVDVLIGRNLGQVWITCVLGELTVYIIEAEVTPMTGLR